MRIAFLRALTELAEKDPRITFFVGDLGFSVVEPFAERFPKQFLNTGVAEQNMTGLAAGMALSGKIVFTYSIANFPTLRCLEQIRNDVCYHNADVKVVSVGGGLTYGALGSSHQATEDIAILRSLPDMTVVCPGDPFEAYEATLAIARRSGPCFLRLGKAGEPRVHPENAVFSIGRAAIVREGRDLTMITTGNMLASSSQACERLASEGVSVRLLSMHTIKPLDEEAVRESARLTGAILTVEEHSSIGGLGSAVAETLSQSPECGTPLRIMALDDSFCRLVGSHDYLRRQRGLGVDDIVRVAREHSRARCNKSSIGT
jgi:transketolase